MKNDITQEHSDGLKIRLATCQRDVKKMKQSEEKSLAIDPQGPTLSDNNERCKVLIKAFGGEGSQNICKRFKKC